MRLYLILILLLVLCFSCNRNYPPYDHKVIFAMGTVVDITLPGARMQYAEEVADLIHTLSETITSDCELISAADGEVEISEATYRLLEKAIIFQELSGNHFNVSVHTLVSLYGFPEGPFQIPSLGDRLRARGMVNSRPIEIREHEGAFFANSNGLKVDLGSFAKGWIVDEAAQYLKEHRLDNFIVNAGGDLYAGGIKYEGIKWVLGIADPDKVLPYLTAVELSDEGLATSGVYERFFEADNGRRISHIFDAVTGESVDYYKSLSVIAATAEMADAFSTIYFLLTEDRVAILCEEFNTPVYYIRQDGQQGRLCGWEAYEI